MKNVLLIISFICCAFLANAQVVNGTIVDAETGEPLIGASVLVTNTTTGTITDFEGNFELNVKQTGDYTLLVTYTGYADKGVDVVGGTTQLGNIAMDFNSVGLKGVELIASIAKDRRTPVAVSTLKGEQIEALVGNQEFPEVLRKTPSIYVTKEGGGFGDARINVRGFDQTNVAVMVNGIPVNDMENGWVYWSNWAGLSDVTSTMQIQRGLGASKLAVPSVGGSINIITDAAKLKSGGTVTASIGNDGYQKYGFALSSGLLDNGWAFTMQGTHTRGDGYIDGTEFRAFSYFGSVSKVFNDKHTLTMTALGAPQTHHQRTLGRFDNVFLRTFVDPDDPNNEDPTTGVGIRFNPNWGTLNGEEFSFRKNFYHKPKAFINHYWNINSNMELKTSLYASYGWGGGTGPRGRIRTPGSVFSSFGGFGRGIHNQEGQVRWDDLVAYNQGQVVDGFGDAKEQLDGEYVVTADGRVYGDDRTDQGSGFIRRASMNNHSWYGGLSTLTADLNPNLNLVAGVDARYYKGEHFRRLENLLGADAYLSRSDDNNPQNFVREPSPAEFGNFYDPSYKDGNNVINYWNDGLVSWLGLFTQLEHTTDKLSAFISLSGSNQGFKRIDYFNYLDSDPERETDWQNFWGGTAKLGVNYNINENHNVFVNAGAFSRQPLFDNVFLNFRNDINEQIENQQITAFEAGYGLRSQYLDMNVNYYYTNWGNRQFDRFVTIIDEATQEEFDAQALFRGVDQRHQGIELELTARIAKGFEINGMASLGDWEYTNNFTSDITNTDTGEKVGVETLFAEGLKVGDAAQTTASIGAAYRAPFGLRIYADYYYADRLFANYDIFDDQFFSPGAEIAQLPSYSLVDAGASYDFTLGGLNMTLRANVNNVLDEIYIAEMDTNILDNPATPENELYDNRGFFGFGRTWNTSLKIRF
ncbi:MAG: carboxypeptidase-like regulatory domain-containing protein [Bacteroidota bacterium]